MLVQEPIQAAVWHCLNHYAYVDATFLAERLLAEVDSEEALHLLATVYYRSGKVSRAYTILRLHGHSSPHLKYLMAKCCYDLGKLDEAEATLTGGSILRPKQIEEIVTEFGSLACFALQLLGLICTKTERIARATEALRRSLKLNPFLWHSFSTLCDHGDKPDPSKVFKLDSLESFSNIQGNTVCTLFNNVENSSSGILITTDSVVTNNKLNNVSMNTPNNENSIHPSSPQQIMNHTQNIHSQQQNQTLSAHITSSNPLSTNVPLITTTPVQQTLSFVSTPIQHSLAVLNTPVSVVNSSIGDPLDSFDVPKVKKLVRFQRVLGPNSSLSPISPSFGVLPLDLSSQWSDLEGSQNSSVAFLSPSPLSVSQLDSQSNNKMHINIGKRILCRNVSKDPPLVINKPTVFAPTGNNSNFQSSPAGQAYVRRSSRLFGNSSSVKENNKNRFIAPKSPARKTKTRSSKTQASLTELNEKNKSEKHDIISSVEKSLSDKPCIAPQNFSQQVFNIQKLSAEGLMTLLRDIGNAYVQLSQYNCRKAIELFSALPSQHYNTGWVLSHLAKSYFEMNDYEESIRYFSEVREKEPHSLHLMEYYSTALWHQQKEVQLSSLAQDLVEVDRDSPESWCATGNCFSLQKEHEAAIKFFSRAIQVDSGFAYAYTLLGHEYLATEELDRALSCYRSAVRIDPRHYNAWYGIGLVLFKQERFAQAEWHFKKAVCIHPQCSVLLCHVAVVEHTLQKSNAALSTLNKALSFDSRNPLCKYHRASILHSLDRHQEALEELLQLKEIVPKESTVYFLLGKVYKRLGDTHLALINFSWAMDLDPKDANNQFKDAIDPAINCFLVDEEDHTNNNPQENVTSEANSSLMAAESSQESLILEPTSDNPQISGMEDHPLSTSLSASILGPSSGISVGSSGANIPVTSGTEVTPSSSTSGIIVSAPNYGMITPPSASTPMANSSCEETPNSSGLTPVCLAGSSSLSRSRLGIPCSRVSPPRSGIVSTARISLPTSSSSSINLGPIIPSAFGSNSSSTTTSGHSNSSNSNSNGSSSISSNCSGTRPTVRFGDQRSPFSSQIEQQQVISLEEQHQQPVEDGQGEEIL